MPKIASKVFVELLMLLSACDVGHAEEIDLYVLAGQSNMYGIVQMPDLPADLVAPQLIPYKFSLQYTPTLNFNSAGFVDLQPLTNFTNPDGSPKYFISSFASELTFGQSLEQRSPNKIAILKVAANATSLAVDWNPATPTSLYHRLISSTGDAMAELASLGYEPQVKGLVWAQGEDDASNPTYAQHYGSNLDLFLNDLRNETWFPSDVPIIINQLSSQANFQFDAVVRNAQAATVAGRSDHVFLLNNDDLPLYVDNIHYTGAAQLEIGRRLANLIFLDVPEPTAMQAALLAVGILGISWRKR